MNYLIYDADCGICTKLAEFYTKQVNSVVVMPSYEAIEQHLTDLETILTTVVYIEENRNYQKSEAVFKSMKKMSIFFKLPAYLLDNSFCIFLFNPLYDLVARQRAKISNLFGLNSCKVNYKD